MNKFVKKIKKSFFPNEPKLALPDKYKFYAISKERNWNFNKKNNYEKFLGDYVRYFLPFVLETRAQYGSDTKPLKILDFGCGWGPMAIALKIYQDTTCRTIQYYGVDVMVDAINFLSNRFQEAQNFSFFHNDVSDDVSYILKSQIDNCTSKHSDGSETKFETLIPETINVQWSSSVFTHLTENGALEALNSIAKLSDKNAIQINTWLVIDDLSILSLSTGQCDRVLPFDNGAYLTNSKENPLNCTAFKIENILEYYAKAGLEILDIQRGSWRGGKYFNDARHYQDVIISRPNC